MRNVIETMLDLASILMESADGKPHDVDYSHCAGEAKFTYILDCGQKVVLTVTGTPENEQ